MERSTKFFALSGADFWLEEQECGKKVAKYKMEVSTSSKEGFKIIEGEATEELRKGLFNLCRSHIMKD